MSVFIHSDFLSAVSRREHPFKQNAETAIRGVEYERLFTTEGMISQFLAWTAQSGHLERRHAVEVVRGLYLRPGTIRRIDFAQFTSALDAYRDEFLDSMLTLEDVVAVLLLRDSDSTDILSANPEFQRYGLRPLLA